MSNIQIIGQALCCGEVPEYGCHNFHVWEGRKESGFGVYCPKCEKSAAILSNDSEQVKANFALQSWNRTFQKESLEPKLNAPEGYRWGSLRCDYTYMGGRGDWSSSFILFKTDHDDILGKGRNLEYVIDEKRLLKNLTVMNCYGDEVDLNWFCKLKKQANTYVSSTWCTDGTAWYNLNFHFYGAAQKHINRFKTDMESLNYKIDFR